MGSRVCGNLQYFYVNYWDVSYGARDRTGSLTDNAIVRLAEACPKLETVRLQYATKLIDEALLAFFRYCPNLNSLEITGKGDWPRFSGQALEALEKETDWVPNLEQLDLPHNDDKRFMKAMRSLSKRRLGLTIGLFNIAEYKSQGDWDLSKQIDEYWKGRVQR